jgi:hypothetical protein
VQTFFSLGLRGPRAAISHLDQSSFWHSFEWAVAAVSRLVSIRPRTLAASATKDTNKDRLERLAKYIPGEIIATYLFLNGISATAQSTDERRVWYALAFAICLIFTPIYFRLIARPGDAVRTQQVVSTVAFAIWAYSLGSGMFSEFGLYRPIAASFLIAIFSLSSALIIPKAS